MRTFTKCLAAAAGIAALGAAAPAAAQFYPGYGYPGYGSPGYGYPGYGAGGVIGSIINSVTGGGYGGYNVPGGSRIAASQCTAAVQQRLAGGYAYGGGYGRVLSINSVEIRGNGGYTVRGLASAAGYAGGAMPFSCRTDPRGFVTHVGFNSGYGNGYYGNGYNVNANPYYGSNTNNPYAVYGYSRY